MSTIRKSPDGRFHVITLSAAEVEKEAAEEMKLAAAAASERLDAKLKARNERGREMMAKEINNNDNDKSRNIFEIDRAEREAKAKIASIEAWNAYAANMEASGKALDAWEANKGKRKARVSQWLMNE